LVLAPTYFQHFRPTSGLAVQRGKGLLLPSVNALGPKASKNHLRGLDATDSFGSNGSNGAIDRVSRHITSFLNNARSTRDKERLSHTQDGLDVAHLYSHPYYICIPLPQTALDSTNTNGDQNPRQDIRLLYGCT
jgi:hypothetical protein